MPALKQKVFSGWGVRPDEFLVSFTATLPIQASVNQLVPDGKPGKFTIIAEIALLQHPPPAGVHGLWADPVSFGYFVVGVVQGQPSEPLQCPD